MKHLRKLGAAALLTLVLGLTALAGQIETPPCAAPVPGQVETPPCAAAPGDTSSGLNSTAPGDLSTPVANNETSFADFAADLLLNFLPLY
ncbi:MAG: hypothetical protein QOK48_3392 [Blastocatellia bacterium]|jgi:hypothetical protein|nr:hypothetical protein [Blastocatellia bacterium]